MEHEINTRTQTCGIAGCEMIRMWDENVRSIANHVISGEELIINIYSFFQSNCLHLQDQRKEKEELSHALTFGEDTHALDRLNFPAMSNFI
ncbi:hypothetical protein TNCV_2120331 [Trichonephila clavipes]|nr:hypothetical protein TNCV_2120331 [Trichonephila clavipes]